MSGGIDSTVAALLLHNEGYDVIGITMKTWDYSTSNTNGKETGCCNIDSFNDARLAAVNNGFPHYILDIREEFGDFVIENFVEEYLAGRTAASVTYTLPTVAELEAVLTNSDKVGTAFTFRVVNIGTSSATAIIAAGTGWTITGSLTMTIPVTTGATLLARKSAAGAWTLYRVN